MKIWTGTSGFSYGAWRGAFYPADLPASEMLAYYASRLPAVEINNTFYRMPRESVLESWASQVPDGFRFALKAPRRITHVKRLRDTDEEIDYFVRTASTLADRAGVILYQLPPTFPRDLERLREFVGGLPNPGRSAFEFRHSSWFDDEVFEILRGRNAALCVAETDDTGDPPFVVTADWGYLRLRRAEYSEDDLGAWAARIRASPWKGAYAFFKHEEAGVGPRLAQRLRERVDA